MVRFSLMVGYFNGLLIVSLLFNMIYHTALTKMVMWPSNINHTVKSIGLVPPDFAISLKSN